MIEAYQLLTLSAVCWLVGYLLAAGVAKLAGAVSEWWSDRQRSKQTTLLPDGKGGFIALPKGATYVPVRKTK